MTKKTAYLYGARDKTFLSGTPFYLARALEGYGSKSGAFDVVDLAPRRTREVPLTYAKWCLQSGTTRIPLFLLTQTYLNRSTRDLAVPDEIRPYFIIWGQGVPASIQEYRRAHPDSRIILYNDATILDLIQSFDYAANAPRHVREEMFRDEKKGYAQADLIAVFHEEVRTRMIKDYAVPAEKIWVIGRGVNLDAELLSQPHDLRRSALDHKFHMMVVGRGPRRKGVFRLIEAIDALPQNDQDSIVLTVAGPEKSELPSRPYLRPLGFISEDQREMLAGEMAASDLGVLLSNADSLPGSIWEFLALKVPVWVSKLPCIVTALDGYPAIIEDLSQGTPALTARLNTFLHQPKFLPNLVAQNTRSLRALTWDGPAEFLGQYICNDSVQENWRDQGLEMANGSA